MKIVKKDFELNKQGSVKILIEEQDDLWFAYNIIAKGDTIINDTTRKIVHSKSSSNLDGNKSSNKGKNSSRVKITLEIKITDVDYSKDSPILRVRGRSVEANNMMASGSYHTMEIEKNKEFSLTKKVWDSDVINTLRESENPSVSADLAVMILQPTSAQVFLVGHKTILCAIIDAPHIRNKTGSNKFYEKIFQAFIKHVSFDNGIRCVMIGSPDSAKEEFRGYLFQEAQRLKIKSIEANKSRFVMVNIGDKKRLEEIFNDDEIMASIKNTKASVEIRAFMEFSDLLLADSDCVCYGPKSVDNANEMTAIETLLITEDLLRSEDIALRKKHMELVKSVKKSGGKVFVFSSMHVSGQQLAQLTGIAAILRFPVADPDDENY